jgi:ribose/xylose/arabinose/galactoside ABC-type transport system permease subunit
LAVTLLIGLVIGLVNAVVVTVVGVGAFVATLGTSTVDNSSPTGSKHSPN